MKISSLAKPTAAALALTFCGTHFVAAQENGSVQKPATEQADNANKASNADAKKDRKNAVCPICGLRVEDKQDDAKGLKVVSVKPDSAADKAGIKKGDTLVSINDQGVDSSDQMHKLMSDQQQKSEEAKVDVKLLRGEEDQQVTLTLKSQDAQKADSDQAKKNAQAKKDQAKKDQAKKDAQAKQDAQVKMDQAKKDQANQDAKGKKDQAEVMQKDAKSADKQARKEADKKREDNDKKKQDDANKQASLGVTLDPSPSQSGEGVRISSVYTNGPAQQAGLKTGDRILKVDGKKITSVKELQDSIDKMDPDHKAKITVMADGEEEALDIVVASKAETIKRAMVDNQSATTPSTDGVDTDQTLSQTLTEIRNELRDLQKRVDAMENDDDDGDRDEKDNSDSDDADRNQ